MTVIALPFPSLRRVAAALATVFLFALAAPAGAEGSGALGFVQKVGNTAIADLTAAGISDSTRVKRMRKLLSETFDVETVSRFVLGPFVHRASAAELKEFMRLYEIYVAHNYAGLFKRYNGEKIEMQREQALANGNYDVFGVIRQPSGPPINMEMRVHRINSGFKAVDLKIEGVSMPLTHRKQFASVITQRGNKVSGLIDALQGAVTRFEKETPSE
jgi:phospholipid transport system substrate-binding protein